MFDVLDDNYKGRLHEIVARYFRVERLEYFHYEYGPSHNKVFLCICIFAQKSSSHEGRTKIEAEQFASRTMLNKIQTSFFKQKENKEWIFIPPEKQHLFAEEIVKILGDLAHDYHFDTFSLYGDALLRYFISDYLYKKYSFLREGIFTRIVADALSKETRAEIARYYTLESYITSKPITPGTLAEMLSAILGKLAFFGRETFARDWIMECYCSFVDRAVNTILSNRNLSNDLSFASCIETHIHNFIGRLQEGAPTNYPSLLPSYTLLSQEGKDHNPVFTVQCVFKGHVGSGRGKTVSSARQEAAREVLTLLEKCDPANRRSIRSSNFYAKSVTELKRFKEPELLKLKSTIRWPYFECLDQLMEAFTLPSQNPDTNYQRLEFLGDAILKKILLAYILETYSEICSKAILSPALDTLVSAEVQAQIAKELNLNEYIFTSQILTRNILADVLEALIAAIYLDAEKTSEIRKENPDQIIASWFQQKIELIFKKYSLEQNTFSASNNFSLQLSTKTENDPFPPLSTKQPKVAVLNKQNKTTYAAIAALAPSPSPSPSKIITNNSRELSATTNEPLNLNLFPPLSTKQPTVTTLNKQNKATYAKIAAAAFFHSPIAGTLLKKSKPAVEFKESNRSCTHH